MEPSGRNLWQPLSPSSTTRSVTARRAHEDERSPAMGIAYAHATIQEVTCVTQCVDHSHIVQRANTAIDPARR